MNDLDEINQLLHHYGSRFDDRDSEGFADLFTDDAVVVGPAGHEMIGREKLVKMVARTPAGGQHVVDLPAAEISDGHATAVTSYRATMSDGSQAAGRYESAFVRTEDGWRISRHV